MIDAGSAGAALGPATAGLGRRIVVAASARRERQGQRRDDRQAAQEPVPRHRASSVSSTVIRRSTGRDRIRTGCRLSTVDRMVLRRPLLGVQRQIANDQRCEPGALRLSPARASTPAISSPACSACSLSSRAARSSSPDSIASTNGRCCERDLLERAQHLLVEPQQAAERRHVPHEHLVDARVAAELAEPLVEGEVGAADREPIARRDGPVDVVGELPQAGRARPDPETARSAARRDPRAPPGARRCRGRPAR